MRKWNRFYNRILQDPKYFRDLLVIEKKNLETVK